MLRAGVLKIGRDIKINSYHASFIDTYLAERLLETGQSFAFETVMSHGSKITLLKMAHQYGYKTYLYFIFADTISTNIARVKLRALHGGHDVNETTIKSRAPKTFDLLPTAFSIADSAYVIDNSDKARSILSKEGLTITRATKFPDIIEKSLKKILKSVDNKFTIKIED